MDKSLRTLTAILLISIFWSTSGTVTKLLLPILDSFSIAAVRFILASILIFPFYLLQKRHKTTHNEWKAILPWMLFSFGNVFFFYLAIQFSTANDGLIIYTLLPIITVCIDHFFLHSKITKQSLTGIILGFIGILFVFFSPLFHHTNPTGSLLGNFLFFCGTLSWSIYSIASKKLIKRGYSAISISSYGIWVNAVFTGIYMVMVSKPVYSSIFTLYTGSLLLYLVIFVTILTFIFYQWIIKQTSPAVATTTNYLQPIFGFIINWFLLGEQLTPLFLIGSLITITGVILTTKNNS